VPRSLTPVEPARRGPGHSPCAETCRCCLPRITRRVGLHDNDSFGILSRGPPARCLRFTTLLAHSHARLACAWQPPPWALGTFTRGSLSEISGRYLLPFRPGLSWRTV